MKQIIWLGSLISSFLLLTYLSQDFGITYDEPVQHAYGIKVYQYFATFFEDKSSTSFSNLYLYGGMYDLFCAFLEKITGADSPWGIRHMVNAFCGGIFILFTSLLCRTYFDHRAAICSIFMVLLSPRFFGHMMNNSKDIPFAAFFATALYFMSQLQSKAPHLSRRHMVGLFVSIALCLNVRVGGLLLFFYFGLMLAVNFFFSGGFLNPKNIKDALILGLKVMIPAYFFGLAFWPWAHENPFVRPFIALAQAQNFTAWDGTILTGGKMLASTSLPWFYIPKWFLVTCPPIILVGFVIGMILMLIRSKIKAIAWLGFFMLFPIVYVVFKSSVLYDGWRHLLFIYSPFICIAAYGLSEWLGFSLQQKSAIKIPAILILLTGLAEPLAFHLQNHPNQVTYFSPIIGGTSQAAENYELDYWGNCTKESYDWSSEYAEATNKKLLVTGTIFTHLVELYAKTDQNLEYTSHTDKAHLQILGLRQDAGLSKRLDQDPTIIYKVRVGDAIICAVRLLKAG